MNLSSREVRIYIASLIDARRGDINERLQMVRSDDSLGDVLHYFTKAIPQTEAMPCVMIEQQSVSMEWQAVFPAASRSQYDLNIWCVSVIDDDRHRDDTISELATAVASSLNDRHLSTEIEAGKWLYFGQTPPVYRIDFGVPNWGTTKMAASIIRFRGNCDVVTVDPRLGPVAVV